MIHRNKVIYAVIFAVIIATFGCNAQSKEKALKAENDELKKELKILTANYNKLLAEVKSAGLEINVEQTVSTRTKSDNGKYILSAQTHIGHTHLKVSDLEKSIAFYRDLLGFELTMRYGTQAAFLSAGGYHHHIGLNTWTSKGAPRADQKSVGLYHTAILYPTRRDLALAVEKLLKANYPISGASDHGVSEAIYLDDPDGNGVELYWDKPRSEWPENSDGSLNMYTKALNFEGLMKEI